MTRIFAAVLLCAASSVGCSSMKGLPTSSPLSMRSGGRPQHLAVSNSAPRPPIERASYDQPTMGVSNVDIPYGEGAGMGMLGCCDGVVDGCVSHVLDCNGGCSNGCNTGGCYGGGCYGAGCRPGLRGMIGQGHLRALMSQCSCGGTGQCACCQHARTMIGGPYAGGTDAIYNFNRGPQSAQVAYPYYTVKGPRCFFLDNPPSIGPY